MQSKRESTRRDRALSIILGVPVVVIVALLLFPVLSVLLAAYLIYGMALHLVIWTCWCTRGIHVLLVYSDSPNWHGYIDKQMIPRLPPSTVLLNWSHRRKWNALSLPVLAFRFFGGSYEFNPLVLVFRPFRLTKTYRFCKPFRDYKHGKTQSLETMQCELFQHISRTGIRQNGGGCPRQPA